MATTYGPQSIVTNGLTMYVDASNPRSYNPVENLWATSETALLGSVVGASSTLNAGAGPFGGAAWTITVSDGSNHYLFDTGPSLSVNDIVTHSVYVKSNTNTLRQIALRFWTGAGRAWTVDRFVYFNLATETVYSTSGTILDSRITNIGNDWYRLSITAKPDQAGFAAMSVYGSGIGYSVGNTYQVAGFQLERNWGPTTYTATSGSAVNKPTTWTDLTGNGNGLTLVNSPAFYAIGNSGGIRFNGVDQEAYNSLNYSTGRYTIMVYNKYESGGVGRILTSLNNNWLLGAWGGNIADYYAEGWVSPVSNGGYTNNWVGVAGTGDSTADWWELYRDGKLSLSNNGGSAGPNGLRIAVWSSSTERSVCQVGAILAYNRVLSADEIYRNHNALRGRYGI